jgi:hypothetical protein
MKGALPVARYLTLQYTVATWHVATLLRTITSQCLSTETETETETFLYVCTSVLLNIPGARVLPGNLSARYTGIRANPIRAPGT